MRSLLLAALLFAPQEDDAKKKKEEPATHTAEKGKLTPTLELDATFEAVQTAEVRLKLEAYHGELKVLRAAAHGSEVKTGETILEIDRTALERQIAALENDFRVARTALEKAQAELELGNRSDALSLEQAVTNHKNAQTELKIFDEVDGKQILMQADLSVRYSQDNVNDQQEELDQLEKMYKSEELTNATAEIVVRRARRSLERSKVYLSMTRDDSQVVKDIRHPQRRQALQRAVALASQSLEGLRLSQALTRVQREAELVRAQANVVQQEEQIAKLRRDLEALTVKAARAGRVFYGQFQQGAWSTVEQVAPFLRPGERVQPNQILMTVAGPELRARLDLPEASYFDAFIDQEAAVAPVAMPDVKLEARVRSKGVTGQPRGFELKAELLAQKEDLLPGMKAKATLKGKTLDDVLLVPSNAVSSSGSKHTVNVLKDGKPASREVKIGKTDGKMTEVKSGLEVGEKVVLPK